MQSDTTTTSALTALLDTVNKSDPLSFDLINFLQSLDSISSESCKQVQIFLENLKHLQEHYQVALESLSFECPLFLAFKRDLNVAAHSTLATMIENCMMATAPPVRRDLKNIKSLLSSDVRALVPSRMLAKELGVSDQTLRREIYLARQKASMLATTIQQEEQEEEEKVHHHQTESVIEKDSNDGCEESCSEAGQNPFPTTCASPLRMEDCSFNGDDEDEWLDVEAWLRDEIFA